MIAGCFSLLFIERSLIWIVVVGVVMAVANRLWPGGIYVEIVRIIIGGLIAIAIIVVLFELLACVPLR